jgi:hypothetical protein
MRLLHNELTDKNGERELDNLCDASHCLVVLQAFTGLAAMLQTARVPRLLANGVLQCCLLHVSVQDQSAAAAAAARQEGALMDHAQ